MSRYASTSILIGLLALARSLTPSVAWSACYGGGPGTYYPTGDIIIENGQEVEFCYPTTIYFAPDKQLIVRTLGKVFADRTVLSAANQTNGWKGVRLDGAHPDSWFYYSTIKHVKPGTGGTPAYYIYINNTSPIIEGNILTDPVPIYVYGNLYYPSGIVISGSLSQPILKHNYVGAGNGGIMVVQGAAPWNKVRNNEVYAHHGAAFYAGQYGIIDMEWLGGVPLTNNTCGGDYSLQAYQFGTIYGVDSGHSFRNAKYYTFWAADNSYIDARFNYTRPNPPTIYADATSTILSNGQTLASNCTPMKQYSADNDANDALYNATNATPAFAEELREANRLRSLDRYEEASTLLMSIVDQNRSVSDAGHAIGLLGHTYTRSLDPNIKRFVSSLSDSELRESVLAAQVHMNLVDRDTVALLSVVREILDSNPGGALGNFARGAAFDIYLHTGRLEEAALMLDGMIVNDEQYAVYVNIMKQSLVEQRGSDSTMYRNTEIEVDVYPNPLNPSGAFRINLPEADNVVLTVHDLLGRKVATIAAQWMAAGLHELPVDASRLATGHYIYRLQIGDITKSGVISIVK